MVMDKIALTLLIIGGLNWGSVGLFQFDLVAFACRRGRQLGQPGSICPSGPVRCMVCFPAVPGSRPRRGAELTPAQSEITDKAGSDRTAVRAGFSEDFGAFYALEPSFFTLRRDFTKT